jgi:hypothetical protein
MILATKPGDRCQMILATKPGDRCQMILELGAVPGDPEGVGEPCRKGALRVRGRARERSRPARRRNASEEGASDRPAAVDGCGEQRAAVAAIAPLAPHRRQ